MKKIGIIGLGNVGEAVIRSLKDSSRLISRKASLRLEVKGVCDVRKDKKRIASKYRIPFTTKPSSLINDPDIDIIVELIGGIGPAHNIVIAALKKGKHVVTANKALLASHGKDIFSLAQAKKREVGFEASVCAAIPLIKSISKGLVGCEVKALYGILNGTTNYILDKMTKERIDFNCALAQVQNKGFAEKNPTLDIEGIDSLHKLCILSYLCFGVWPPLKKVYAEGISRISLLDILYAQELNYRIKLLAIAKKQRDKIDLRVHPTLLAAEHLFSDTSSAYNAVYLNTYPAGELLFYGEGAGGVPTSSSVISDIVSIALNEKGLLRKEEKVSLCDMRDVKMRYYMRIMALDRPGVLAKISKILSTYNISIASVTQKERDIHKFVPIVMITHEAREDDVCKALSQIDKLSVIKSPSQKIRIEDL
ncbi:MAG: homoserine dehydrogenase [Candidatus Omnitrophota bacterium]|nr:MAG: homoserine dehydrogenase [Candidatus Omnitrophota bacterium]